MEVPIAGKLYKPSWEHDGDKGEWYVMNDTLIDILENKPADILWHQTVVPNATPARRYYDLKNMTQCRQHLDATTNEWMTVSRIVKIRRIYREVR